MSMHRTKCRNSLCKFEGMMEAKSDNVIMKKNFLNTRLAKEKARGMSPVIESMHVRCPKCGTRWRMRADQLR